MVKVFNEKFKNVPVTQSLEQVFGIEKLNLDDWLTFNIDGMLREINYSKSDKDIIEIRYEVKGNDVLYFARMSELVNMLNMIYQSGIKYNIKEIDNQIFIFFN